VVCANEVAKGIADKVSGAVAFTHQQGCCQTSPDLNRVTETLCGLGCNPNLAAVLLIGLGCEGTEMPAVQNAVAACGKPVQTLFIQELGGAAKTTAKGVLVAQEMAIQAGTRIYEEIESVASGTKTKAEISGYVQAMDIYVTGPVI
jgi:altronate dehydratase large subunit